MMDGENLPYIIPLHRNNAQTDFSPLQKNDFKKEMNYFIFQDGIIWYYPYQKDGYQMVTFLDERLRTEEEKDYLKRIETHPEAYSKDKFDLKLHRFGTLTVVYKFDIQQNTETGRN